MITEDYVSFETAKLLKEKGFNWKWPPFYSEEDRFEWVRNNNYNIPNPDYDANIPFDSEILNVIAPHVSLQMAMKWLREVYKCLIVVGNKNGNYLYLIKDLKANTDLGISNDEYIHYEEACEAAIKYCLENLI